MNQDHGVIIKYQYYIHSFKYFIGKGDINIKLFLLDSIFFFYNISQLKFFVGILDF